ncbi:E3 ubiquitin-protein ligase RBBP6-like isoform X1 [Quillaja saponaria]|uniref:E3 ubiquitin-protein ligase RBBP6-like isoform X1 n=1 Tax=Quillaja saponaria TaxID=32244 RepID=A0AAD7KT72_QUISA|nr:E3 ubiquitin-protein ligase RBBP6-like isoform X1 [Quillaja saponaria]
MKGYTFPVSPQSWEVSSIGDAAADAVTDTSADLWADEDADVWADKVADAWADGWADAAADKVADAWADAAADKMADAAVDEMADEMMDAATDALAGKKVSVFSRISFPEEANKKRKLSSSTEAANTPISSTHHNYATNGYYDDYISGSGKTVSVFSRISFPEGELNKKRKLSSSKEAANPPTSSDHHKYAAYGYYDNYKSSSSKGVSSSGRGRKSTAVFYGLSDDERHFKRRPSRYEPTPLPPQEPHFKKRPSRYKPVLWPLPPPRAEGKEKGRHSRRSRERKHK